MGYDIGTLVESAQSKMKRFVIYTAVIGGYDQIRQPEIIDDRFDYVLFSNDLQDDKVGVWTIKHFSYSNSDSTRISRYIKTHPETLLPGYDFSIWIDSNIQISSDFLYTRAIALFNNQVEISALKHSLRNYIYDELFAVVNLMVEHEAVVLKWGHLLRKEGCPKNLGLSETGILYRCMNPRLNAFNELWWNCISRYSRRDQLSFNYCLWKSGLEFNDFLGDGRLLRDCPDFILSNHNRLLHNYCEFAKNEAWLMRHCWKHPGSEERTKSLYYRIYATLFPVLCAYLLGQVFRVLDWIERKWKQC